MYYAYLLAEIDKQAKIMLPVSFFLFSSSFSSSSHSYSLFGLLILIFVTIFFFPFVFNSRAHRYTFIYSSHTSSRSHLHSSTPSPTQIFPSPHQVLFQFIQKVFTLKIPFFLSTLLQQETGRAWLAIAYNAHYQMFSTFVWR